MLVWLPWAQMKLQDGITFYLSIQAGWESFKLRKAFYVEDHVIFHSRLDARDKCLGLVHWDDPEEWGGEGGGRGFQDGEHM